VIRTVIDGTQGLTWVDVVEPTSAELTEIAHLYGLHPTSVRDSLDPEHLPKFERFPDRYFAIIRVFDVASSPDCATVHEMTRKVAIFAGPDFVVTIHRKALPFLTSLQQRWHVADGEGNSEPPTHRRPPSTSSRCMDRPCGTSRRWSAGSWASPPCSPSGSAVLS